MAFSQVTSVLLLDANTTVAYTQPINMAGANAVHVSAVNLGPGSAFLHPQFGNELDNWTEIGNAISGTANPLMTITGPSSQQKDISPNAGGSPFNRAIGSTWVRFVATRIGGVAALNINTNTFLD